MMAANLNFKIITNDTYKTVGRFPITYGIATIMFGQCLIGVHKESICHISLFDEGKESSAIDILQQEWPNATLTMDNSRIENLAETIFSSSYRGIPKLDVILKGTELQCNVWKELTTLKEGMTANYQQLAKAVGNPKAIRAVASAIAKNKIAYLIPCHRVIRKTGAPNKYRWGPERKLKMLKWESEH